MNETDALAEAAHRLQMQHYTHVARYMEAKAAAEAAAAEANLTKAKLEVKTTELMHLRMQNANRPSIVLQAQIKESWQSNVIGGKRIYTASYAGVSVVGDTPEMAFENFDRMWSQGREQD